MSPLSPLLCVATGNATFDATQCEGLATPFGCFMTSQGAVIALSSLLIHVAARDSRMEGGYPVTDIAIIALQPVTRFIPLLTFTLSPSLTK